MAGSTLVGSWFVEEYRIILDLTSELVTATARYIHVRAFEGEVRARLMVKKRGLPACRIMATLAAWIRAAVRELPGMDIFVTAFALPGRGFVDHVLHGDFQIWWLVAIDAGYSAVRAGKLESRRGMIELQLLRPCGCVVAGFTTPRRSVGTGHFHSLSKLATMRIRVARRARQVFKAVKCRRWICTENVRLVALHAGHCHVRSRQRELCKFVPRQGIA